MFGISKDIGMDLGTANVLVYLKGKGIVLREPSVVAIDRDTNKILEIGEAARQMIGRTPGNIVAVRPLRDGVIADYSITEKMIQYFIEKVAGHSFMSKPRVVICIPSKATTVEKRAVQEAAKQAGASFSQLIEEPMAAALGVGIDVSEPQGVMIIDIGGGTTDVAVISMGGIVVSESLRIAGDKFDEAIIKYVKAQYNILIGERTAEKIKINVATASRGGRKADMQFRGRDLLSGLPKNVEITSDEIAGALEECVTGIVHCVKKALEITPPELSADIMDHGIVMTGGGAMLHGLDALIQKETGITTYLAEDPLACVALGTGKAIEWLDKLDDKKKKSKNK